VPVEVPTVGAATAPASGRATTAAARIPQPARRSIATGKYPLFCDVVIVRFLPRRICLSAPAHRFVRVPVSLMLAITRTGRIIPAMMWGIQSWDK
jgi:hypothetical protein